MLKKTVLGLATGALFLTAGSALAETYQFDKQGQHAFIEFRIQHLGYSWVYGSFKDFDGTFTYDAKDPSKDKVEVTIKTGSIDTNHAERDKHLRGGDFLNAAKFPEAKFVSTEVKKDGDVYKITGDFTLNGVTKPITLDAKLMGEGKDPWGGYRAGFEAQGNIKLKEFNIKSDLGPKSQEAELLISVEGVQVK
ncbi:MULTISPECIES: YceI family protein [Providencia]|uniref:YceI family protein n=1 Tax=Providencia rettgeri TaxID=587 RepID=A0A3R9CRJ0_PRORE|nr:MULTISPECIES: YceI family protein [Providencia]ELR5073048.1 YceI family protein [Providencia stuartii]ELR5071055.1 YceI family protein [Providencia rettgeri]ELR5218145.1 YceI family protein [Providencia rettgeri]ELR5221781.1 YceI family protein [Providencia rettgeri]MBV2190041.1 YceI family protein [Providencia rettgeri]